MNKRATGSSYEEIAAAYLTNKGYEILEKNYRNRQGEIDLIAREGPYLVFIEVKFRRDDRNGTPAEAVDYHKQQKIIRTARHYLMIRHCDESQPCRFDVVAILGNDITVIQNAFY